VSLLPVEYEHQIGNASMQIAANNNLVFTDSSSFRRLTECEKRSSHAGLYQGIARALIRGVHAKHSLVELATRLVSVADDAYSMRRLDLVRSAGELLLQLPLSSKLESIADYYIALGLNRSTLGEGPRAGRLFERVAENATSRYRGRALLALGSNQIMAGGDLQTAVSLYRETMRIVTRADAFDPMSFVQAARMTAVIKGMNGDHRGAIVDLEKILPLARAAAALRPHTYYDYLNSLSVELTEVGRLENARRAAEIALASPFAPAYPEWQETFDEIVLKQRRASRSTVAVCGLIAEPVEGAQRRRDVRMNGRHAGKRNKLFSFPLRQTASEETGSDHAQVSQARVLDFQQWKRRVESDPAQLSALSPVQRMEMSTGEKLIRLMDLISHDDTDDETIDVILEAVEAIVLERKGAS
jgi:tetratricopeptide (TPR) repeat protein